MQFKDIPGHAAVKNRLMAMVDSNTLPHALVLEGIPGIGKLALAMALASYVHCENRREGEDSCGECPSCRLHRTLNHVDTIYSFPVVKRGDNPVSADFMDEFRKFVSESVFSDIERWTSMLNRAKSNTKPAIYVSESAGLIGRLAVTTKTSDYKIVVQWLPERLNESAANKLLKLVEEPFSDTLFIFVSNNPGDILPTIYSRTQRVAVKPYDDATITEWLRTSRMMDPVDAAAIAHLADGSMLDAIQLLSTDSMRRRHFESFKSLMRLAYQRDVAKLRDWASELAGEGRETEMKFYEFAMRMVRENFMFNFNTPALVYLDREESAFSRNFARFISEKNVEGLMATFQDAHDDIAANGNGKIINLDVAIQTIFHLKNA